jgi:hypothetical protein
MEFNTKDWILGSLLLSKTKLSILELRDITFSKANQNKELRHFTFEILQQFKKIGVQRPTASYLISRCENFNKKMNSETGVIKRIIEFLNILPDCEWKHLIEKRYELELGYHQKKRTFIGLGNHFYYVYIIVVDKKYSKIGYSKNPIS